jgi:hypothetical protein
MTDGAVPEFMAVLHGRCSAVHIALGCCGQAGFRTDCLQI